jgi:RimJ/RimL family protein N-acetyltransferase
MGEGFMIRLEYLDREGIRQIIEWNRDTSSANLMQWAGPWFKYPLTEEQYDKYFSYGVNCEGSDTFVYKIVDEESNKMIGTIEFGKIDMDNKSARIGKFLLGEESCRGKGIGKEVLNKLLLMGFEKMGLHKISLGVFDFNSGAIKCYEGAGFVKEGLFRDYRRVGDSYWNLYEMSILEDEWRNKNK